MDDIPCQSGLAQKKWDAYKLKDSPELTKDATSCEGIFGNGVVTKYFYFNSCWHCQVADTVDLMTNMMKIAFTYIHFYQMYDKFLTLIV